MLKLCEKTYVISDEHAHLPNKEIKRRYLVDIAEYVSSNKGVFNEQTFNPFMSMISANLLRSLPVSNSTELYMYDAEDDEPFYEPLWPHLQVVYELLRKFVVSSDTDSKLARSCITVEFVTGMVELFNSEDVREREYLKTILHRIYGKVMPLRGAIRQAIMNVFHRVVYENQRHNGIGELLEILGSVINGFAIPLKEEHKVLLRKCLLPLHMPTSMPSYHEQLSFCVTQFVELEPALGGEVIQILIRHWPTTHTRKEVMLLGEIEEVLELTEVRKLENVIAPLFKRIGRCIESPHFQVAGRALFYWNNSYVVNLMNEYRTQIVPAVVGCLQRNTTHWNSNVVSLSSNVQKQVAEADEGLYEKCCAQYEKEMREQQMKEEERMLRWRAVYRMAQRRRR